MAGHSKWANIKHRKERQDAKKGKIFTKWIRELTVAARQGGGDPGSNPRLRLALDKALGANMSRDIIDRAVPWRRCCRYRRYGRTELRRLRPGRRGGDGRVHD